MIQHPQRAANIDLANELSRLPCSFGAGPTLIIKSGYPRVVRIFAHHHARVSRQLDSSVKLPLVEPGADEIPPDRAALIAGSVVEEEAGVGVHPTIAAKGIPHHGVVHDECLRVTNCAVVPAVVPSDRLQLTIGIRVPVEAVEQRRLRDAEVVPLEVVGRDIPDGLIVVDDVPVAIRTQGADCASQRRRDIQDRLLAHGGDAREPPQIRFGLVDGAGIMQIWSGVEDDDYGGCVWADRVEFGTFVPPQWRCSKMDPEELVLPFGDFLAVRSDR